MSFKMNQKVVVRKKRIRLSHESISLSDWISNHCFTGEILSITETEWVIGKIDSVSFFSGRYEELYRIARDSVEYDVQAVRAEPVFQTDPFAIAMP